MVVIDDIRDYKSEKTVRKEEMEKEEGWGVEEGEQNTFSASLLCIL